MLVALQTMNFWLRTAFGESSEAFGGTTDNPLYGISQGSGSAPTSYITISTLALETYKQCNFHFTLKSVITGCLLLLAAILFVDDTDQLHLSKKCQSEEHFMQHIQAAITFWGMLILATGGYIKQLKSQVDLSLSTFVNGRPKLKTGRELPTFQFIIPQKDRNNVPIPTVSAVKGTDSLSVRFDMENKCVHQVDKIKTKGSKWMSRLNSGVHISPHEGWCSYCHQLKPSLSYSALTLSADPKKVEAPQGSIAFRCLLKLEVNQHTNVPL